MTPYRTPAPANSTRVVYVTEPLSSITAVLVVALLAVSALGAMASAHGQWLRDASLWWQSPLALVLFGAGGSLTALATRREAWIVLEPRRSRVLVATRRAFSVTRSTLGFNGGLAAEYASFGSSTWLVLVSGGHVVPVLPSPASAITSGARERVEAAIEEALTAGD